MSELALRISATVTKLQKELRCGICCSTFKDPVHATCHHIFCRQCLDACFARKRKVQCPICRSILDKRSCRDAFQLTHAVQYYLKLSEAFKQDVENMRTFKAVPPEKAFVESQMPMDVTIIPENDGKRCAPDFAIPLMPARRKKLSKSNEPSTSDAPPSTDFTVFAIPTLPKPSVPPKKQEAPRPQKLRDMETITDPLRIQLAELQNIDIQEHIDTVCHQNDDNEIDALFQLMPSMEKFLQKNAAQLISKLGLAITNPIPERRKSDKRVSFASSQNLEDHRYPESAESSENVFLDKKVEVDPVMKPKKPVVVGGNDDDEVVEDSEPEEEKDGDTQDMDIEENEEQQVEQSPENTAQSDMDQLDEELSRVPMTIVCSRIHNDEDEVELLSDFYNKFLSNSCRFAEAVDGQTTHLVMMNSDDRSIPQKSSAYLHAVARKCIIVGRQWFVDCIQAGVLLPETNYTITSCPSKLPASVASKEIGWLRSRKDENGKLFQGHRFMILRRFNRNKYFDYRELITLVQLCGGEILSNYENQSPEKLYIIFSKHSDAISEAVNMNDLYKCEVVTMEWVMDSISEYSILPTDTYQAVDAANRRRDN